MSGQRQSADGSGITINRSRHAQQFVTISNTAARDTSLSFRARGLHHHLLSLPDGWRTTTADLADDNPESVVQIRAALAELERAGYVTVENVRGERGRLRQRTTVHDDVQAERTHLLGKGARKKKPVENSNTDNRDIPAFPQVAPVMPPPETGGPVTGGPVSGERATYLKTVTKDDVLKTQDQKTGPLSLSGPAGLEDLLAEALPDATDEEREALCSEIQSKEAFGQIRHAKAWLRTVIANGDAPDLLEQLRADKALWHTPYQQPAKCGRPNDDSLLSTACRSGRWPDDCVMGWCECLCHSTEPTTMTLADRL